MDTQSEQEKNELDVFKKFVKASGLQVVEDTIQKKEPPEPDIGCLLADGDTVGFELCEAVDPNLARSFDLSITVKTDMRRYFDSLPSNEKEQFKKIYGNANLFLKFSPDLTKSQILNSFPDIFLFLLSLDEKVKDDIDKTLPNFPVVCDRITIYRGCFIGPMFNRSNAMHISSGVFEALKSKFRKNYDCSYPVELVVHSDTRPLLPVQLWMKKTSKYIEDNLQNSPFRRVWVFDLHNRSIEYVFPSL